MFRRLPVISRPRRSWRRVLSPTGVEPRRPMCRKSQDGHTLANGESAATVTEWTAKLKAREEEALRKCQEEGGCGAEVAEEEGPGEETFGDPFKCYAGGTMVSVKEHATINGYGGCNQGLPAGTWIKVCVYDWPDSSPYPTGGCSKTLQVKGHTSRYWSIGTGFTIQCSEGDIVRGYIAFWVPGGRTLYAGTEEGECTAYDESVWEALTPWQALPDDIGVV